MVPNLSLITCRLLRNERAASFPYHGIRIIHSFRGYQGFPRRRDQRHPGSFHHISARFRNPSRRFSFVRGHGRSGQRFPVARSAGSWQTSPERSSPGSPCSGKDRRTLKYAGTASMTRRQSTNGLKTITLKHYATKIQTEGLVIPSTGAFTLRAASGKEAARLVSEQCGTVLNTIRTTLSEESEVDWHFDKHPRLAIREVIALPETLDGEKLPRVGVFHPGQRVFRSDPDYEMSGCCVVCSGNDDKETPSDKDLILICCSDSETEVYPCELRPISDNH